MGQSNIHQASYYAFSIMFALTMFLCLEWPSYITSFANFACPISACFSMVKLWIINLRHYPRTRLAVFGSLRVISESLMMIKIICCHYGKHVKKTIRYTRAPCLKLVISMCCLCVEFRFDIEWLTVKAAIDLNSSFVLISSMFSIDV